ncbi:sperm acrosome-associated protein 7-like isoform X2 [Vicugna pacos]|uniref:Sperm acrosome-associated protein 7-like isoform X2 n=1 Tax=Vicugna pacos TaxID=30538 RepID=A0ABM5BAQ6_VICPA
MAASSGVTVLVLLLCCWRGAELQPINMTTGPTTETMSSKNLEDIPGVFDEILVEEILEPNKSSVSKTQKAGTTLSSKLFQEKNSGTGENYQLGGPEGHHELSDISQFSLGAQDKILNNAAKCPTESTGQTSSPVSCAQPCPCCQSSAATAATAIR